mmetsp:Transcript_38737/g.99053  ORF Transcript_38737/g.99053 Transcript_38737/m.99053 type:complete len:229 (+) Transcript_38737:200-886(+)|eukprot:jgi/Tetstr1/423759/TSEL_014389.t1
MAPATIAAPGRYAALAQRGAPASLTKAARLLAAAPPGRAASACRRRKSASGRSRFQTAQASGASGETSSATAGAVAWEQKIVRLPAYKRGCHVVTRKVLEQLPELCEYEVGMANFFIQHTSASLTINENASPDVPLDLNDALDKIVPEGTWYRHLDEGPDDMPAHVKSSLMGPSLDIPVRAGCLALGTWQGIYLNEHRDHGGARSVVVTVQGQKRADGRKYPAKQHRW